MNLAEMNLSEDEKALLRKRWGMDENEEKVINETPRYTVFFPEDKDGNKMYGEINLRGQVPSVGDRISFRNMGYRDALPEYNHQADCRQWHVKQVYWCVNVQTSAKDQLLHDHTVRADVIVDFDRWGYWWQELMIKFYYSPKRKIKDYFRKKKKQ